MSEDEPVRSCVDCQDYLPESDMIAIDVSRDEEYYPRFDYVCPSCYRRVYQ